MPHNAPRESFANNKTPNGASQAVIGSHCPTNNTDNVQQSKGPRPVPLRMTPDMLIALMQKILLDYKICHPGDHRYTDPTYYFHPPSATPRASEPEPRSENPSALALSTGVDDGMAGQDYASASDHPAR